jgi:hypothetical protein
MVLGGQPPGRVGRRRFLFEIGPPLGAVLFRWADLLSSVPTYDRAVRPATADHDLGRALSLIEDLSASARRPCSYEELAAALRLRGHLREDGIEARLEPFPSYPSFAAPYGLLIALAVGAGLVPRRRGLLRSALSLSAAVGASLEGDFRSISPGTLFARRVSQNIVAEIEPSGDATRTLCLLAHIDSSRSGLMFHPGVTPHLGNVLAAVGVAFGVCGAEPLLRRTRPGRIALGAARALLATAGALVAERELRGVDVAGANDNASGAATTAVLAAECAAGRLRNTRLVLLITGSEEANVIGSRAFLGAHDTSGWLFLNFDGVGAPATLHHLHREGGPLRSWKSDPGLRSVAERVSDSRPELALSGTDRSSGLPYDSTPILARGGRAITLTVQNGSIPNYHSPTDTASRIDRGVLARALETGREMIAAIDRGEADP